VDAGALDCNASDAEVAAACAPTYDEQLQKTAAGCAAGGDASRSQAGVCGQHLLFFGPNGLAWPGVICLYDGASRALVAFQRCLDSAGPGVCMCRTAGVVSLGCEALFDLPAVCRADAGEDGEVGSASGTGGM
jgi:hypothetical protein